MEYLTEAIAMILSSSGIIGGVISVILRRAMKTAAEDAARLRAERLEEEMLRYELDAATSSLLVVLSRYTRGLCSQSELDIAEANYTSCVKNNDMMIKRRYVELSKNGKSNRM